MSEPISSYSSIRTKNLNTGIDFNALARKGTFEIEPVKRNYVIREVRQGEFIDLRLVRADGKERSLSTFFSSRSTKFKQGEEDEFNLGGDFVQYIPSHLQYRGAILRILHEIAHANRGGRHYEMNKIIKVAALTIGIKNLIIQHVKEFQAIRRGKIITSTPPQKLLPSWYRTRNASNKIRDEIETWNDALKLANELEEDGYNVLSEFGSEDNAQRLIDFCLATYHLSAL